MNNQETKIKEIQTKTSRVLNELQELINQGLVTKGEVLAIVEQEERKEKPDRPRPLHLSFQQLLYFIGGFIVILGMGIFVAQFWVGWSQIVKVVFALGLSAFLYAAGYGLYYKSPDLLIFGRVCFILSACLLPLGIGTFLDLVNISAAASAGLTINFALLFIIYFSSYQYLKEDVFLLAAISTASGFYISITDLLIKEPPASSFYEYRILLLGAAYCAFGYYFKSFKKYIVNLFYLFGLLMLLGTSFALSIDSGFWFVVFPLMLVGVFYASVVLQSKLVLSLGTIFTFAEIGRITSEYFSGSLGWPIALIIAGFSIILVGYLSFKVSKRYINTE